MGQILTEIVREIATRTDEVLLAMSCGADSVAMLDLCRPHFRRVECFFMYLVRGISFQDAYIEYLERRYGTTVHRVPHWHLSHLLRTGTYRPQSHVSATTPELTYQDIWAYCRKLTGIQWIGDGSKAADSFKRRQMLVGWRGIYAKGERFYPLTLWTDAQVTAYLRAKRVPLSPEYEVMDRSFNSMTGHQLLPLSRRFPADYHRVLEVFPYARAVVARAEERERQSSPIGPLADGAGLALADQSGKVQSPDDLSRCQETAEEGAG